MCIRVLGRRLQVVLEISYCCTMLARCNILPLIERKPPRLLEVVLEVNGEQKIRSLRGERKSQAV